MSSNTVDLILNIQFDRKDYRCFKRNSQQYVTLETLMGDK